MSEQLKESILVVDDIVPALEMLSRLLSNNGYNVLKAQNGRDAIAIAKSKLPDLILLDVMMPEMSGHEVMIHLSEDSTTRNIPVIFVTAKDDPSDVESGFKKGAVDYIKKPVEAKELLARTRSKLEAKRLQEIIVNRNRDLEILLQVSNSLNRHMNVSDLLKFISELVLEVTPVDFIYVFYQNTNNSFSELNYKDTELIPNIDGIQKITNFIFNEFQSVDVFPLQNSISGFEHGAVIAIRNEGQSVGFAIALQNTPIFDTQVRLLEGIVKQLAIALINADLFELRQNYAEELERTVESRTQELIKAQELLIRSEKLASVGRLASAIAHEINNPLTPVVLNLELMVEDMQANRPLDENDIIAVYHSAQRIKRIVERILQFTRQGKENDLSVFPVDIEQLIKNVTTLSRHYFQQNNMTLTVEIESALPQVMGNSDQLEQVFLNMMINAKDAMDTSGILSVIARSENGNVIISFTDTGKGIPEDMMGKLFEPFTSSKGEKGSGLGLFVSYEIIKNHNGSILVDSVIGKGTVFTIHLPAM
jgi:signal transduction histidine kinase/CheY-like chemotaxis protein